MEKTNLTREIVEQLLNPKEWLSDDIFTELVGLTDKSKFQGMHPPAVGQVEFLSYDYTRGGLYLQPLHANHHWAMMSFDGTVVRYYDSIGSSRLPKHFLLQMARIVHSRVGEIEIHHMICEVQAGYINCGLYALSNFIDLYRDGELDRSKELNVQLMRKHIARILIDKKITAAPKNTKRNKRRPQSDSLFSKVRKVQTHCFCCMPEEYSKWMIQCEKCKIWMHGTCINHPDADITTDKEKTFQEIPGYECQICAKMFDQ